MLTLRPIAVHTADDERAERLVTLALIAGFLVTGMLIEQAVMLRLAFLVGLLAIVLGLGIRSPRTLLLALPVWLAFLGLSRRLLSALGGAPGEADPLLLVGPAALILLAVSAVDRGAVRRRTGLSTAVLALSGLVVLGALNPLQGSLLAGLSATLFFLPLLAFWIGRALATDGDLRRILLVVAVLGVPAAGYGLFQTFAGFPSWDDRWIREAGYTALNVRGTIRPFSTFASGAEYATFLAVGVVTWLTLVRGRSAVALKLLVVPLLVLGAVFQASRGTVVVLVAALALLLGARSRLPLPAAMIVAAVLLALLPVVVQKVAPADLADEGHSRLLSHQVEGLSDPFDPSSSTARNHLTLITLGVKSAFVNPIGHGISAVTIAGSKFGSTNVNTEADPSNAAVALGLPGLVAYAIILVLGFSRAYRLAVSRGDPLTFATLGILAVTILQWLNGGLYAVALLPWLVLGWLDRKWVETRRDA